MPKCISMETHAAVVAALRNPALTYREVAKLTRVSLNTAWRIQLEVEQFAPGTLPPRPPR